VVVVVVVQVVVGDAGGKRVRATYSTKPNLLFPRCRRVWNRLRELCLFVVLLKTDVWILKLEAGYFFDF
jgi:hypothetical protein